MVLYFKRYGSKSFRSPRIRSHSVLAVKFDASGNVTDTNRSGISRLSSYLQMEKRRQLWAVNEASWKICLATSVQLVLLELVGFNDLVRIWVDPYRITHISRMIDRMASHGLTQWHGTTIVGVKRGNQTVIVGMVRFQWEIPL